MDKVEYKILTEEIKKLINKGEFVKAVQIADRIDWNKVHSIMMLCTISDLYKANRRFEDAKDLLYLAYKRSPNSRTILYSLCDLSIKLEEYISAIEYYKAFVEVAPKDAGRYVLQYRLYQAQEANIEDRIEVLVALKKKEYIEKWAYELAYLYHRIGLATECVDECDELILWFGEGKYVNKAMELKMLHQPLTEKQEYKYNHRFDHLDDGHGMTRVLPRVEVNTGNEVFVPVEDSPTVEIPSEVIEQELQEAEQINVKVLDVHNIYSTMNLEKELANSLKAVYDVHEEKLVESVPIENMMASTAEIGELTEEEIEPEEVEELAEDEFEIEEIEELAEDEFEIEETEELVEDEFEIEETEELAEDEFENEKIETLAEEGFDIDDIEDELEKLVEELDDMIDVDVFHPSTGNLVVIASDVKARDAYISEYITSILGDEADQDLVLFLTGFKLNRHFKQYFKEMDEKKVVVISNVDTLRDELVENLWTYLDERHEPLQLIFTDKKKTIAKVYNKHKKIEHYFTKLVELEETSVSDLVDYGVSYAENLEYSLDEVAVLALETMLEAEQVSSGVLEQKDVEAMIDCAIEKVNKKCIKHFMDVLLGKRYDKEDRIILKEQYF